MTDVLACIGIASKTVFWRKNFDHIKLEGQQSVYQMDTFYYRGLIGNYGNAFAIE